MTIADIHATVVDGHWRNWIVVEVCTDGGLVGLGEATLEGREHAVLGALTDFRRRLLGREAADIADVVDSLSRRSYWDSGPVISSAIGGVEMALWDLAGKRAGQPLARLLGGSAQRSLLAYSNAWYFGAESPAQFGAAAAVVVAAGFTALKFDPFGQAGPGIDRDVLATALARIAAVRATVGADVGLMIEGHGRFDVGTAIEIGQRIEAFDPLFFEEPIPPGDVRGLEQVAAKVRVPLAAGERCYGLAAFADLIDSGAVTIVQPDVIHVGGVTASRAVAAMAASRNLGIAFHNASGPVATAATLQVAASVPNAVWQEMFAPDDAAWKHEVAGPAPALDNGRVRPHSAPGLGVCFDRQAAIAHPFVPRDLSMFESGSIIATALAPAPAGSN